MHIELNLQWRRVGQGIFKGILELRKRGSLGTEVRQRGPGAEPR